jgi:two-component system, chemotaxis family, protein-glutamate methylesterase/glutaminase
MTTSVRVLVVDDSAFARKVVREVLARAPGIDVVGVARDGLEALEKIGELKPDVVTLDLLMPELDGLGVLRALPVDDAPRVVVVSISPAESEIAVEALASGAIEVVTKPTALATDRMYELSDELIGAVRAAALARPRPARVRPRAVDWHAHPAAASGRAPTTRLIVIGTSTGGPQALSRLFPALPAGLPVPLAIALHIPEGYTAPLAARLSEAGAVKVREAEQGMEIEPGEAVLAPGGRHLRVRASGGRFFAEVSRHPLTSVHHPSVDVLFESAADQAGAGVVGVVLTGMGDDGLRGARAIRQAGGRVLAESAASCVVFGMPRCVIEANLADEEAPLDDIPERLVELIFTRHDRRARTA